MVQQRSPITKSPSLILDKLAHQNREQVDVWKKSPSTTYRPLPHLPPTLSACPTPPVRISSLPPVCISSSACPPPVASSAAPPLPLVPISSSAVADRPHLLLYPTSSIVAARPLPPSPPRRDSYLNVRPSPGSSSAINRPLPQHRPVPYLLCRHRRNFLRSLALLPPREPPTP